VRGSIAANHGHVAVITGAQIADGGAVTLDIQGTATHTHSVRLAAAQIQAIGTRQRVGVTSTTDSAHNHVVTFN